MASNRSARPRRRAPFGGRAAARGGTPFVLLSLPLLLFLMLPLSALIGRAPPELLLEQLTRPEVQQAVGLSLRTSLTTTFIALLLGTPLAYVLAHQQSRWARLFDALVELPTVLPPTVAGLALLLAFGRRGLLGAPLDLVGIQIAFTSVAVVMAQLFVAAPLYVRSAAIAFARVEPELEQAAALDGASAWQSFLRVTLPLSRAGLVGGATLCWARALGEFGATLLFAGNFPGRTQTMPLAIYLGFEMRIEIALTLSVLLIVVSLAVLLLVRGALARPDPYDE